MIVCSPDSLIPFYSNSPKNIVFHTWLERRPQLPWEVPWEVGIGKAFIHLWEIFFLLRFQCWCFSPLLERLLMIPVQVYERLLPVDTAYNILLNTLNLDNTFNESMWFCFLSKYSWFLLSILIDLVDHSCYFSLCFYLDLSVRWGSCGLPGITESGVINSPCFDNSTSLLQFQLLGQSYPTWCQFKPLSFSHIVFLVLSSQLAF